MDQLTSPFYDSSTYTVPLKAVRRSRTVGSTKTAAKRSRAPVRNTSKRTVKYLGVCRDTKAYNAVVKTAPDSVIKTICNAALNVQRGGLITLSNAQKKLFARHRGDIAKLVSKKVSVGSKRKVLTQRGGAFWIPALIAAASALGPLLFGKKQE